MDGLCNLGPAPRILGYGHHYCESHRSSPADVFFISSMHGDGDFFSFLTLPPPSQRGRSSPSLNPRFEVTDTVARRLGGCCCCMFLCAQHHRNIPRPSPSPSLRHQGQTDGQDGRIGRLDPYSLPSMRSKSNLPRSRSA